MTTTTYPDDVVRVEPTKRQPSQTVEAYLEAIARDLADNICAAEERGDDALAEALNKAADALDKAIELVVAKAEPSPQCLTPDNCAMPHGWLRANCAKCQASKRA